jgi:hypothetical protein
MDTAGAVIVKVDVEIKNTKTGLVRNVVTNESGAYVASVLPVGLYQIAARHTGFVDGEIDNIVLSLGERQTVNITLASAGPRQSVNVVIGPQSPIELARSNLNVAFNNRSIHDLPMLGRNFQTFVLLTPGTLPSSINLTDTDFSVGGQKGIHTTYNVDGSAYNSAFFGGQTGGDRPPFTLSLEAVQEFVVYPNGSTAEFGSGGGLVNVVTKSGTNDFHGNAFWYLQDHRFIRRDALGLAPLGRRQQFGATIGGPLVRNKLFFFVASDNQKRTSPLNLIFDSQSTLQAALTSSDPNERSAAQAILGKQGQISAGDNTWSIFGRVDWQMNSRHRLSIRYNTAHNAQENGTFGTIRQRAAAPENSGLDRDVVDQLIGQAVSLVTPRMTNEFRLLLSREDRPRVENPIPGTTEKNGVANGATADIAGIGTLGSPVFLPIGSTERRLQLADTLSWSRGRHEFRVGGDVNLTDFDDLFRGAARGLFLFFNFDNFAARQPDIYLQFFGNGHVVIPTKYVAGFVQDTFRPKEGLTINYGLRWEGQINTRGDLPNTDFLEGTEKIPNDLSQWSPRLGISWVPGRNSKQVLRFFSGYLHAPTPTALWFDVLRQNGDVSNGVLYFADRQTNLAGIPAFNFPYEGPYQTPFESFPNEPSQSTGTVPGGTVNLVDPKFHNPRIFRANVGYERQVGKDVTLSVTYDYSFTTGNERFRDLNLFPGTIDPLTGRTIYDRTQVPVGFAGRIISRESTATARYHALIVALNKRFSSRFQIQAFYNYGRNYADDENERNTDADSMVGYDQRDFRLDWSRSALDIRHQIVANCVVDLPRGISLSALTRFNSGRPFNAVTGSDDPLDFLLSSDALANFQRQLKLPNASVYGGGNGDGNSFSDRPIVDGRLLPRNYFNQPIFFETDVRVQKRFQLSNERQLFIIGDFFNVSNRANSFTTNVIVASPSFGSLNNAGSPFAFQFGVKVQQ